MGGSFAPPNQGGGAVQMPIPLLHVNGVPTSSNMDAAVNRTIASAGFDLTSVIWNQRNVGFDAATLRLGVGAGVNSASREVYLRALQNGTSLSLQLAAINPSGVSLHEFLTGATTHLRVGTVDGQSKVKALSPLEAVQGLTTNEINGSNNELPVAVAGTSSARFYASGGAHLGSGPSDPGAGNLRVAGSLTTQNLTLGNPTGANISYEGSAGLLRLRSNFVTAMEIGSSGGVSFPVNFTAGNGTKCNGIIGYSFTPELPAASGSFTLAAGASTTFTLFTGGNYTRGNAVATAAWQLASATLDLSASVSGPGQVTLRIKNNTATNVTIVPPSHNTVAIHVISFDYSTSGTIDFIDNFNRANSLDAGPPWTLIDFGSNLVTNRGILNNELRIASTGDFWNAVDTGGAWYKSLQASVRAIECDITANSSSNTWARCLMVRETMAANSRMAGVLRIQSDTRAGMLWREQTGGNASWSGSAGSNEPVNGSRLRVEWDATGSEYKIYINGVLTGTRIMATPWLPGFATLGASNQSDVRYDNYAEISL